MAAVTPYNGNDFVLPDGSVYQLGDDGLYHFIPDVATANAMHIDWNGLQPVDSLDSGSIGAPIPDVVAPTTPPAQIVAATRVSTLNVTPYNGDDFVLPDGSVYQFGSDGLYHYVPNVATGNAMHIDWNALQPVDSIDADSIGAPILSVV